MPEGEVVKQINDCEGRSIITIPEFVPNVEAAKKECPSLNSIIVVGESSYHSFFQMASANEGTSGENLVKGKEVDCTKDTAALPYSSGTTGPPKGVELAHSTFTTNLVQINHPLYRHTNFYENGEPQEKFIAVMPFFHLYGLLIIMTNSLYLSAHSLCLPKFDPNLYVKAIKQHRPTTLHLVTPIVNFIIQSKDLSVQDFESVKGIIIGAAPVGNTIIEAFLERVKRFVLFQEGFGMTEIAVSHILPHEIKNTVPGSCGVLTPSNKAKIVDLESGKVLGPNEIGEICIRGPQVMKGYYKNEEATKNTFDSDGFLKTGDIGRYDEHGFFYIEDRLKELIKVKGLQVAPSELENVLRQHPEVLDVAVIGVPNDRLGEAPRAYIVSKSRNLTEDQISDFIKPLVAPHKLLKGGIQIVDAIPKAPSGKILRRVIKEEFMKKKT